jgi:hypothetical protein
LGTVLPGSEYFYSVFGIVLPGSNYFVQLWVKTFSGYLIVPHHLFRKTCVVSELEISSFCVELTFLDPNTPPKVISDKLNETAALTRKAPDTHSEFYGRRIERGVILKSGHEIKISSDINSD